MNNMKSKDALSKLRQLSLSIGDFIRYWGFRRVHGAIWAQLYLSKTPLSCVDLTERLDLSKALISPALEELVEYDLIYEVEGPNQKTKLYSAEEDVNLVIKKILKNRECELIKKVAENYDKVKSLPVEKLDISTERLDKISEMVFSANLMLKILVQEEDLIGLPREFEK